MINYKEILEQHQIMKSERITLRSFASSDLHDLFEFTSDEEATRYLYPAHTQLEQAERMLTNYYLQQPTGIYAIEHNTTKKMIGTIEFRVKEYNNNGELGYTLHRHYWGNGYMKETVDLIYSLAFEKLQLARIFAEYDIRNEASRNLTKRIGMKQDGILRQNHMVDGFLTDSVHCSILKEEYFEIVKK